MILYATCTLNKAFLEPYTLIASSQADFQRRLAESDFQLPPGYRLELGEDGA